MCVVVGIAAKGGPVGGGPREALHAGQRFGWAANKSLTAPYPRPPPHPAPPLQVRVPVSELPGLVRRLTDMEATWADVAAKYPAQAASTAE